MENKLKQGETLFAEEKIGEAEKCFLSLLEKNSEDVEALNNLGVLHCARGNVEESESYLLKALAIKEDYSDALLNLADLYQSIGRWKEAAKQLERLIRIDDHEPNVLNQLGVSYLEMGNMEKARSILAQSIKLDPGQKVVRDSQRKLVPEDMQRNHEIASKVDQLRGFYEALSKKAFKENSEALQQAYSKSEDVRKISDNYKGLSNLYAQMGDTQKCKISASLALFSYPESEELQKLTFSEADIGTVKRQAAQHVVPPKGKVTRNASVLFAPVVIAGNSVVLSRYLRKQGVEARSVDYFPNYLGYKADYCFEGRSRGELVQFSDECLRLADKFDIIIFDFGCSFKSLPSFNHNLQGDTDTYSDMEYLRKRGKKIFVSFCGSDVNSQSKLHYYYLKHIGIDLPHPPHQTRMQYQRVKRLSEVSDCFLGNMVLDKVIPKTVPFYETPLELEKWQFAPKKREKIRNIISAPTERRKKNYDIVESAINAAKMKYPDVQHLLCEGIPHSEVAAFYKKGDLGVTQATYTFGLLAVELMALGIPVMVAHAESSHYSHRDSAPIIRFNSIAELYNKLERVLRGEMRLEEYIERGREYVEAYHAVNIVGDALLSYIEELQDNGRIREVVFSEFAKHSAMWHMDPEAVHAFKYFDVSVPCFCALGKYEQALTDCSESIVNGYRRKKFEAWFVAISKKVGVNEERCNSYIQAMRRAGDSENLDRIKYYLSVLFDPEKLLEQVESAQNEAGLLSGLPAK